MGQRDRRTKVFRRPKCGPRADFWHTLRVGLPLALLVLIVASLFVDFRS